MGMFLRVAVTICVALLAFYLYSPAPSDVENKFAFSKLRTQNRVMGLLAQAAEFVGISDERTVRRNLNSAIAGTKLHFQNGINDDNRNMRVTNTTFDGINVWVLTPRAKDEKAVRKGLVYFHGGGFVVGAGMVHYPAVAELALRTGAVIVIVEYRLAPEHPSPAALDDCYAATRYFFTHAREWGVDAHNIGGAGDSAGGNMAAVLSLKFRDEGGPHQFAYQILIYPWTQAINFRTPSYDEEGTYMIPSMTKEGMATFTVSYIGLDRKYIPQLMDNQHVTIATWRRYSQYFQGLFPEGKSPQTHGNNVNEELAKEVEAMITNPYNFPLMADSLAGVPAALVVTVRYDTIRDDGILYAKRLRDANVDVEYYHDELCWHVAFRMSVGEGKVECGVRMLERIASYINRRE